MDQIKSYQKKGVGGLNYIFYKDDFYSEFFEQVFNDYEPGKPIEAARLAQMTAGETRF